MLLVVILNVSFFVLLNYSDTNLGYEVVHHKWGLASNVDDRIDTLIVGDSSGDQGVDPSHIENSTTYNALNLCTIGDLLLIDDVWLLEHYLKRNRAPDRVIVVHVYDVWHRTEPRMEALRQIPIQMDDWDALTPFIRIGWQWKLSVLFDDLCPLYSRRVTLRNLFSNPLSFVAERTSRFDGKGFRQVTTGNRDATAKDRKRHLAFLSTHSFVPSDVNQHAIRRLLKLTSDHNISLVIANSPLDAGVASNANFLLYYQQLNAWLLNETGAADHVTVLQDVFPVGEEELELVDHVTHSAAKRYTDFLLRSIDPEAN